MHGMWASDNELGGGEHAEAVTARANVSRSRLGGSGFTGSKGFPGSSVGKESTCNVGDLGFIPGLGRSPGEGKAYPLRHSGLENPRDGGAWWAAVYGVAQSRTRLN